MNLCIHATSFITFRYVNPIRKFLLKITLRYFNLWLLFWLSSLSILKTKKCKHFSGTFVHLFDMAACRMTWTHQKQAFHKLSISLAVIEDVFLQLMRSCSCLGHVTSGRKLKLQNSSLNIYHIFAIFTKAVLDWTCIAVALYGWLLTSAPDTTGREYWFVGTTW
jgi:hypothetical protein